MQENMNQELMEDIMAIILNAGNARSEAISAIREAKKFDFESAEEKYKLAKDAELLAHNAQTKLLTKEASGEKIEVNLLMVHAQDHLMNCITINDLAREFIDLYKTVAK